MNSTLVVSQRVEAELIIPGRLRGLNPQNLSNTMLAYATLRHYPTRLLQASPAEVKPVLAILLSSLYTRSTHTYLLGKPFAFILRFDV